LAFDFQQRRASWWDPETNEFNTNRVSNSQFSALVETPDSTFVAYIYDFEQAGSPLFAVLENDLDTRRSVFGSLGQIRTDTSVLGRKVSEQGTLLVRRSGELLFAPGAYEGVVYAYERDGTEWRLTKRVQGQPIGTAYRRVTGDL